MAEWSALVGLRAGELTGGVEAVACDGLGHLSDGADRAVALALCLSIVDTRMETDQHGAVAVMLLPMMGKPLRMQSAGSLPAETPPPPGGHAPLAARLLSVICRITPKA